MNSLLISLWHILTISAPYVLLGFLVAGILKAVLPDKQVLRHLGRENFGSVLKATLFGIPLPLCSCGVVPAAMGLRKQGAGRGATSAFLIATPETGVDSIAITYSLMDPIMTVFRPLAAFVTAMTTGMLEIALGERNRQAPAADDSGASCCEAKEPTPAPASCCEAKEPTPAPASCCSSNPAPPAPHQPGLVRRLAESLRYAFKDLLADVGPWLLLGITIAGVIAWALPDDFFSRNLGTGLLPMLLMLFPGMIIYICATASTPIAAALVLTGLSPGAALVFLTAGPATNIATMTVIARFMGRRALAIYLSSIAVCSLSMGLLLDAIYAALGTTLVPTLAHQHDCGPDWIGTVSGIVLLVLIINAVWSRRMAKTKGA